MILVDANLLIYAHVESFPRHAASRDRLDRCINGIAPVGLPWPSLLGFVRIVSNPRIFEHPSSVAAAWRQVESWLATPVLPHPRQNVAESSTSSVKISSRPSSIASDRSHFAVSLISA